MTDASLSVISKPPGDVPPSVLNPHLNEYKTEIDDQLRQDLAHLKTLKNAFEAIDYIMYTLFPDFLGQSEIGMTSLANHLKVLSQDSQMIAYIQSVFNGSAAGQGGETAKYGSVKLKKAAYQKAIDYINALLKRAPDQVKAGALSASVEGQLENFHRQLFAQSVDNGKVTWSSAEDLQKDWPKDWNYWWNPGIGSWKGHKNGTYGFIKDIEDQFSQVSTSLNGASQVVQSNDKFASSQYNQEVGVLKQVFSSVAKEEKNAIEGTKQTS